MSRALIFSILIGLLLSACAGIMPQASQPQNLPSDLPDQISTVTQPEQGPTSDLPDLGLAPELTNEVWINSPQPLRLADLRGKVVLLEMWTFGCINCQNTLSTVKDWYAHYADRGLVVIGNHYPEFSYERDLTNLKDAVQRAGILYPVAQDNEGVTWRAFDNLYWPTMYLIDKRGHLRYTHIGEGAYTATEQAIQSLLAEKVE
jgi:thiol-disulfide isomerase/thioredoxin